MITRETVEKAIISVWPEEHWVNFEEATEHNCHSASLALVKSGLLGPSRVARGACLGVGGQHSWVVRSAEPMDCYSMTVQIVDITLWSYDSSKPKVWIGSLRDGLHTPHGMGNYFDATMPTHRGGETVTLDDAVRARLSYVAATFVRALEPLDHRGWAQVAQLPVKGWPAAEIIEAMYQTPHLATLIPIDRVGMLTNINPQGLYLPGEEEETP